VGFVVLAVVLAIGFGAAAALKALGVSIPITKGSLEGLAVVVILAIAVVWFLVARVVRTVRGVRSRTRRPAAVDAFGAPTQGTGPGPLPGGATRRPREPRN